MKKSDLIKQLRHARQVIPTPLVQDRILTRVYRNDMSMWDRFTNSFALVAARSFGVALVTTFIFTVVSWQNPINRANLTLMYADTMMDIAVSPAQLSRNEAIMDTTHDRLAELNLVGESGKYTKEECEVAYRKFYDYMSKYEHKINESQQHNGFTNIKSKIARYETEASLKWPEK